MVNHRPLSVWTHSTRRPWRAYHLTGLLKKPAEKSVDCSGKAVRKRRRCHSFAMPDRGVLRVLH